MKIKFEWEKIQKNKGSAERIRRAKVIGGWILHVKKRHQFQQNH